MKQTALFIGRFQPLHNGHAAVIKEIAVKYKLKIGIGSAQLSDTKENPLSAAERREMRKHFLDAEKIANAQIFSIPDINNDAQWVAHVKKIVGAFDCVYSGNPLVIRLFKEKNIPVKVIDEIHPYKATKTRTAVRNNKPIESDVPSVVLQYLKSIRAIERMRKQR